MKHPGGMYTHRGVRGDALPGVIESNPAWGQRRALETGYRGREKGLGVSPPTCSYRSVPSSSLHLGIAKEPQKEVLDEGLYIPWSVTVSCLICPLTVPEAWLCVGSVPALPCRNTTLPVILETLLHAGAQMVPLRLTIQIRKLDLGGVK